MTPVRTFLAIPLPETLRNYLAQFSKSFIDKNDRINWVKPGNIHITLNFLGDTDPTFIDQQAISFEEQISMCSSFRMGTLDTGIYPHANDPKVLWVGASPYDNGLASLLTVLNVVVKQLGYELDNRKFQPHITLGRVKSISRKSTFIHNFLSKEVRETDFVVDEIRWFQSTLAATGAIYEELKTFKLKTGGQ